MTWVMEPLGDSAVVIEFGSIIDKSILEKVTVAVAVIEQHPFDGYIECIPSFTTVTVFYDLDQINLHDLYSWTEQQNTDKEVSVFDYVCFLIQQSLVSIILPSEDNIQSTSSAESQYRNHVIQPVHKVIDIPVCYGNEYGPDLEYVATYNHLSVEEVIAIHCSCEYLIYAIGFAPGFPYMGGMSTKIATPRKATPRLVIPAGSVGIAGTQTGIYPLATPGGWQLIGRTPLTLFRPNQHPPVLLASGMSIRFRAIDEEEYHYLQQLHPLTEEGI
ncbi:inhibitor of KinA [Paenibacillus sp. SORGH_AS306]|uniref:5-oxoprolinase subunit PxpB n=1 Tax=unclassified Paenibacillus TaxID=185978 RepID=UPI00278408FE|nr:MULTISPECIES: 5-oxoprolinase subunit PxpB [unclassified Paenibacillus]MDQ1233878.1 inhibitor of KinA [Paenibacillus sp. SORGH_AS_0306]MDR6110923.1 inhibitor of KinA [Paenibacillus sp. SORGH_AS_0338]